MHLHVMLYGLLFQFICLISGRPLIGLAAKKGTVAVERELNRENFQVSAQSCNVTCVPRLAFNESELLRKAFERYDNGVPPLLNGKPVEVRPRVAVMSLPQFDEDQFMLRLKMELVQEWLDPRLDLGIPVKVVLPERYFRRIWLPQLMFENSNTEVHKLFSHYFSLVIYPGGRIIQTIHVSVSTYCKLLYNDYPFDKRWCDVTFGSFVFDASQVTYVWPDHSSFPLTFWEEALEPLTEIDFQGFQLSQGIQVSYDGTKYSRVSFKLLASRKPSRIIKYFVVPVSLLVPASWAPTCVAGNSPARIIAGATVLGITWTAISNRPRGTTLPVGYGDYMDYFCSAIFSLVASSLFQSTAMVILKKRENPQRRALLRLQRRRGGPRGCYNMSISRAILECVHSLSRQRVQRANADDFDVEAGEVPREDAPPAVQPSNSVPTSSWCNSLFHILSLIAYLVVLLAISLQIMSNHSSIGGIWTPIDLIKIKKADRLILENI